MKGALWQIVENRCQYRGRGKRTPAMKDLTGL
jgi:hypothetical protein